jgi:predicted enzyme related to lactoylglutathione lyase
MPYFMVSSADETTDKVKELGGQAYLNPTNVDEKLRIAIVADPQGAVFALFQAGGAGAEKHG